MTASTVWELQKLYSGIETKLWMKFGLVHVSFAQRVAEI